ncbi:MAG: hypothetical protein AB2L14_03565 [Candidatus Xenobiia bacterium LiM19]
MNIQKLRNLMWDQGDSFSLEELYDFLAGNRDLPPLNRSQWRAKALLSIRWYDLITLFGLKKMPDFLTDEVMSFIWKKDLRESYYYAREIVERSLRKTL